MKLLIFVLFFLLLGCKNDSQVATQVELEQVTPITNITAPDPVAYITIYYDTSTHSFSMVTDYHKKIFESDCDVLIFLNMHNHSICSEYELKQFEKRIDEMKIDTVKPKTQIY